MIDSLFGTELPLAVKFFVAFLIVLALIGATFWLIRHFGANRLGGQAARGRQPRLAVIDAAPVDSRRRLVLIRRDNVEHLVMIGGPSDVVIEHNIVRAMPVGSNRPEPTWAAVPAELEGARPLAPPVAPLPRPEPEVASRPSRPPVAPPVPRREDLDVTAREPSVRPTRAEPRMPAPRTEPSAKPKTPDVEAPAITPMAAPDLGPMVPPQPVSMRAEPPRDESRMEPPRRESTPKEPAATSPEAKLPPDASLNEMAQRLEAALRRPAGAEPRFTEPPMRPAAPSPGPATSTTPTPDLSARPTPRSEMPAAAPEPKADAKTETKAPERDTKPAAGKSVFDSLEEEMANLLGRPQGKS